MLQRLDKAAASTGAHPDGHSRHSALAWRDFLKPIASVLSLKGRVRRWQLSCGSEHQTGLPDEFCDCAATNQRQTGLAANLAHRLVGAAHERRNLLHQEATVSAEKMSCGSANFTDTAELGRGLKRVERDARKLRNGDQYFGCVLPATRAHAYAVYDPRASALIRCLRGGSGCARGYSTRCGAQFGSF
jgi:hypothetical protein